MEFYYSNSIDANIALLDAEQSRHLIKVLRHKLGDVVSIVDGKNNLYQGRIISANHSQVQAEIVSSEKNFDKRAYHLTMALAPTKNMDRYEYFLQKACELGVDRIVPIIGEYSQRPVLKKERAEKILISAMKQSLKASLPVMEDTISVKDFILREAQKDAEMKAQLPGQIPVLKMIAHCYGSLSEDNSMTDNRLALPVLLQEYKSLLKPQQDNEALSKAHIQIMIGPEGDFSKNEIRLALENSYKEIHLGTSRLRTETAGVAAVAAVYFTFI